MPILHDDLGHPLRLVAPPRRVVSLVPSLTEALACSASGLVVGATDWCTHPPGLDVRRVRGTKNPDCEAILELRPDLVVANQEENRRIDVERLRAAGVPVWVTVVETVDEALRSLRRLIVDALELAIPGWLTAATESWSGPAPTTATRVVVPIWRDPWMVVGPRTFAGDVIARLGLINVAADGGGRYPKYTLGALADSHPDVVVLPDEPYPFTSDDGPEAFPGIPTVLVSGRMLTWYGPPMAAARGQLADQIGAARAGP